MGIDRHLLVDRSRYGNWNQAPQWSLQANAEWALQFGVAQWNLYAGFLSNATFVPTLEMFNRQAAAPGAKRQIYIALYNAVSAHAVHIT